jgi:hypothetical protein
VSGVHDNATGVVSTVAGITNGLGFVVPGLPLLQILALAALYSTYFVARLMIQTYRGKATIPTLKEHQRIS